MTRKELLQELALCQDLGTKAAAERVLDHLISTVTTQLAAGNSVALGQSFGSLKPVTRSGVSTLGDKKPYTTKSVKFSISAPFKRTLNS